MIVATLGLEVATGLPAAYLRDIGGMARVGGGDMTARLWRAIETYPLALSLAGALIAVLALQRRELARQAGARQVRTDPRIVSSSLLGQVPALLWLRGRSGAAGAKPNKRPFGQRG
jgi:hypothetical protein